MKMTLWTKAYIVTALLLTMLSTQAYLACATNLTTLQLAMLNLKTHHKIAPGSQDGTEDLNSFQLHRWQWRESAMTPPSYLGTTWS